MISSLFPIPPHLRKFGSVCCSFFVEDPEHSDLQYRWKITYKQEQKCQTFEALNMVVLKDSLECFLFWIKRKKKLEKALVVLGYHRVRSIR